jgi:Ca2+-binding RTX toxin-like protein
VELRGSSRSLKGHPIGVGLALPLFLSAISASPVHASEVLVVGETLTIMGDSTDDSIWLRLRSGDASVLEIDVGNDGDPDHAVSRGDFDAIELDGGSGHDDLVIDETNGVFSDSELTTITGGPGKDILVAGSGREALLGGLDNDRLFGGPSADSIDGHDGDDHVDGESGDDNILGGEGSDELLGAEDNDTIDGGGGNDLVSCQFDEPAESPTSNDRLLGGIGADVLCAGPGNDTLSGGPDRDSLFGREGADRLEEFGASEFRLTDGGLFGLGTDRLMEIEQAMLALSPSGTRVDSSGFTGPVTLLGNDGKNVLMAGPGDDRLEAGGGDDFVIGGMGNDWMSGGSGSDELAQPGDVTLTLSDVSLIGAGTDTINGFERASFTGGPSDNVLNASAFSGRVSLSGQAGNDRLVAGSASAIFDGGAGDDVLIGGPAHDYFAGGEGDDVAVGGSGNDRLQGWDGDDRLTGDDGRDYLDGKEGSDRLLGGRGKDHIRGGFDDDTLVGGRGTDIIHGERDNDRIFARDDRRDVLRGGRGFDSAVVDHHDEVTGVERLGRR